jgi:hypothetical protein
MAFTISIIYRIFISSFKFNLKLFESIFAPFDFFFVKWMWIGKAKFAVVDINFYILLFFPAISRYFVG